MSEFEKYLRKHRDQFESQKVDPKIWLSIENEMLKLNDRRRSIYLKVVSTAAAILLGVLIFNGDMLNRNSRMEKQLLAKYGLEEYQFTQQVNLKKKALSKTMIPSKRKEDFQVLLQQLEFLDEQYHDYLKYIEKNGYQSFIGDRLLNYYRAKIDLLDKIQQEIEKVNYYENKFPSNDEQVVLQI